MGSGLTKTYELPPWGADIRHVFTEMAAALDLRVLELSETAITIEGPAGDRETFGDRLEQLLWLLADVAPAKPQGASSCRYRAVHWGTNAR